jgi:hypothetical protein
MRFENIPVNNLHKRYSLLLSIVAMTLFTHLSSQNIRIK